VRIVYLPHFAAPSSSRGGIGWASSSICCSLQGTMHNLASLAGPCLQRRPEMPSAMKLRPRIDADRLRRCGVARPRLQSGAPADPVQLRPSSTQARCSVSSSTTPARYYGGGAVVGVTSGGDCSCGGVPWERKERCLFYGRLSGLSIGLGRPNRPTRCA
jgi:hypothetical protein